MFILVAIDTLMLYNSLRKQVKSAVTYPEGVAEAVVWQHNSHVLFLGAHGHHQHAGRADKGLEAGPPRSEEAARDTKSEHCCVRSPA